MTVVAKRLRDLVGARPNVAAIALALGIFGMDLVTGKDILFPIAYALPVLLAGWNGTGWLSYLFAAALPVARLGYVALEQPQAIDAWTLVNTAIRITTLLLIALLALKVGRQERQLRTIEGILPICASCKRIRVENGKYVPIEGYISAHSEATFTHGICPECEHRLYPEVEDGK